MSDTEEIKAKKAKKDKKDKRKEAAPEEQEKDVVYVGTAASNDEHKKKKKRKHDASAEEPQAQAAAVPAANVEDDQADEDGDGEAERKRLKKEAKKAKKRAEKDREAASAPAAASQKSKGTTALFNNNVSSEDANAFRAEHGIGVFPDEDGERYQPFLSFQTLLPITAKPCPYVNAYLGVKQFKTPSPIQAQCWPPLLSGRDVIGIAATGSGKTLAFLIPGMVKLSNNAVAKAASGVAKGKPSPGMLVMAPTRELAMQSYQVVQEVGGMKAVCIYGGVPKDVQKADLRAGAEIVIATPGRLLDLIEENVLTLQHAIYVVLDEADRMLDEGFEPAIRKILATCPPKSSGTHIQQTLRQTVMFSATWPEEIRQLADSFMNSDPVRVTVGSTELSANHRVTQIVECVENSYQVKDRKLVELLEKYHKSRKNRILIFVLYKKEAVTVQRILQNKGYKVTSIHGDKSQQERFAALNEFKTGEVPLLIATDVAARGLDIPQVEYVLNYSFPLTVEDYVHRIGRTGRGGSTGVSHTFFTDFDKALAGGLVGVLQEAGQEVPKEIYKYPLITKKKTSKVYGDFGPKTELQGQKATKIVFGDD